MTSDVAVAQFLEHCRVAKHLSANRLRAYASDLAHFAGFVGGGTGVHDVDREAVRRYARVLVDEKRLKATTVKRRIATLTVVRQGNNGLWAMGHRSTVEIRSFATSLPDRQPE